MNRHDIVALLPGVFQRTCPDESVLAGIVDAMLAQLEPVEALLDDIERYFDPRRAPDDFIAPLASWVDLQHVLERASADNGRPFALSSGVGNLRALVQSASYLARWRGTTRGLVHFLETATGLKGFQLTESPRDPETNTVRHFHVQVSAPVGARVHEALIRRILEREKPAAVTISLGFREERD